MQQQAQSPVTAGGSTLTRIVIPGVRTFLIGAIALGVVLFIAAGTLHYWQAWMFIVLSNALVAAQGVYLAVKDPELLERRKEIAPEAEATRQKIILAVGVLCTFGVMVFSALDHRFGWSQAPPFVSWVGAGLMVLSSFVYYLVFRENSFAASSVRTFENQKVISTGPYALVRHPKYVGDIILVAGIPLALGSWWGLAFLVPTIFVLAWRILDEESLLKRDLPGYVEYTGKVRYRLVPYLW